MQTTLMSRDCQKILVNNFEKRIHFDALLHSRHELKELLYEMQHIVRSYPLDDDIIDAMSAIVDRIISVITVDSVYNTPRTVH